MERPSSQRQPPSTQLGHATGDEREDGVQQDQLAPEGAAVGTP